MLPPRVSVRALSGQEDAEVFALIERTVLALFSPAGTSRYGKSC
jgi:hypothetical protein